MTWTAGKSLLSGLDELKKFVGPEKLENLEGSDFDVDDLLVRASDAVRASIKGVDPARLANASDYKPAVVEHVLAILTKRGFVPPPEGQPAPIDPYEWSRPLVEAIEPRLTEGDSGPAIGRPVPRVRNLNPRYFG